MAQQRLSDGDTFELEGAEFRVNFAHDEHMDPPWENSDGHGPVSDWERRNKRPGEWVLHSDRGSHRFYDHQAAMALAKRDGWGLRAEDIVKLSRSLGRPATAGEVRAEAVRRDFEYLRRWCNDQWHYVGVIVTLLDDDGEPTKHSDSLWGIESDAEDYLSTVAHELAEGLLRYVPREVMP